MQRFVVAAGLAALALAAETVAAEAVAAEGSAEAARGVVLDREGRPVAEVSVFAVAAGTSRLVASAVTDARGRFEMSLPPQPHELGVMSPVWRLGGFQKRADGESELRVWPAFFKGNLAQAVGRPAARVQVLVPPVDDPNLPDARVVVGASIGQLAGRVVDETGSPLPGVRIVGIDPRTGSPVTVAVTDREGKYTLLARAGGLQVSVAATGLAVKRATRPAPGKLDLELAIAGEPEVVTIYSGHVIRFRMEDSIWPEYHPPPAVQAWLRFAYGIRSPPTCSENRPLLPPGLIPRFSQGVDAQHFEMGRGDLGRWSYPRMGIEGWIRTTIGEDQYQYDCPLSVAYKDRARYPKYWWLRVLETAPPSPARIAQWEADRPPRPWRLDDEL